MLHKIISETRTIPADLETPVGIYLKIRDLYPQSALLESSDYHTSQNSISFIGVQPIGSYKVAADVITKSYPDATSFSIPVNEKNDVIEHLRSYMDSFEIESAEPETMNGLFGYTNRTDTKDRYGNTQSTRSYNNLYDREEVKDSYGNVIGYKKWNDLYKRYDVYNSNNTLIGYYKWNDLYNRWEYHQN